MRIPWLLFSVCWMNAVTGFDVGPIIRIARCRSQCLKKHTTDGVCDWYSGHRQTTCSMCWQYCEGLENRWEKTRTICEGDQHLRCPACQTACSYRKSRVEEKYPASMLPAPRKAPINLDRFHVAVVMRKLDKQWRVAGYYSGERTPNLSPNTWIIVAMDDGVKHYSWQEWVPKLECLKEGPLYEASISWKDIQAQLQKQRSLEQARFNNRVRQFFLEKYGEKVLAEWRSGEDDSRISNEVFRRFFFRRKAERSEDFESADSLSPSAGNAYNEKTDDGQVTSEDKESYVVSWQPETGGLMGNQVTDLNSAQISLLPGTKYLVRIASNNGPGSFPIEVDTRPDFVQAKRTERSLEELYPWDIYAACASAFLLLVILGLAKIRRKGKHVQAEQV